MKLCLEASNEDEEKTADLKSSEEGEEKDKTDKAGDSNEGNGML